MLRMIKSVLIMGMTALLFLAGCENQPVGPEGGDVRFDMVFEYGRLDESCLFYGPFVDNGSVNDGGAGKASALQSADLVRILVADLSAYESVDEYRQTEAYAAYQQYANTWQGDRSDWGQWEKLIGDHFNIRTNQTLEIGENAAEGTVPGVVGLNYFGVAVLDGNEIRYWGEGYGVGVRGETRSTRLNVERVYTGELFVEITSPSDGDVIETRAITVSGIVSDSSITEATLIVNESSQSMAVYMRSFSNAVVLSRGENTIRVEVTDSRGRTASDEVTVQCEIPPVDIRVTLTWNTAGTDLDLYVKDPAGQIVYFSFKNSDIGGQLDVDDRNGYGPENFTLDQGEAIDGEYEVWVRHWGGNLPSTATVMILLHEGESNESSETYGPFEFTGYKEQWDVTTIIWP